MSVEVSGGGASVGSSDRDGGNNVGDEWIVRMDQIEESSEQEKKQFDSFENASKVDNETGNNVRDAWRIVRDPIEESCEREKMIEEFSEREKKQFVSFEKASEVVNKTSPPADAKPKIQKVPSMLRDNEESSDQRLSEQEKKQFNQNEESSDQGFSAEENERFISFEKASKVVHKTGRPADAKPKIQQVPHELRNNDKLEKYFEPKRILFGPYSKYRIRTFKIVKHIKVAKQIKVNLATEFLQQNGVKKEYLYADIKKQIEKLRKCYDDNLIRYCYEDPELAWIFMVDGCAIIQFMCIFVDFGANRESQFRNLGIKFDYELFIARDLFLLENQLPYKLLQLIIRHTSKEDELLKSIYMFIFVLFRQTERWSENEDEFLKDRKDDHVHLLDLLRKKLIQPLHKIDEKRGFIEIIINWTFVFFDKLKCNRNESDLGSVSIPRRNIGKLREAGINLKHSTTSCVGDITFSGGTLKLPPVYFAEPTAACFLNMVGYEMCPDFLNESEVTTYMYILDMLIHRTQDVEELREKNILRNQPGSDEEVVKLFNEISTSLLPNFGRYDELEIDISNYFDHKGLMWLRKKSHDIHQYFKGRWSLLAFIAALLAVVSGVFQSVITFLAYQADSKKDIGRTTSKHVYQMG